MALEVIEICAGAGGQVLGLHLAGFTHRLAFELDPNACNTLRANSHRLNVSREDWVREGDVADPKLWDPKEFKGIDLLAGGVPCPPFTIAGKQLGANDERDLFAWAVEQVAIVKPKALMLENVRGLSMPRFGAYRQHVLDRLADLGYSAEWRMVEARDFGVPQLRPRFVLVAMQDKYFRRFVWPESSAESCPTVGETLKDLMGANGWEDVDDWVARANGIAPTIVGGSKKHGGADLGPTRAKRAWEVLGVDAHGVADEAPHPGQQFKIGPKLTTEMVSRIQGWDAGEFAWTFEGRKTSVYRQIGNAFPPPVAKALGQAIHTALRGRNRGTRSGTATFVGDEIYQVLRRANAFMTAAEIRNASSLRITDAELERRLNSLAQDFHLEQDPMSVEPAFKLGGFKAFVGQDDHHRHEYLRASKSKVS